ncbi:torsin-1A-like isoform X1 [Montipora capricornis]|uniref:torsin-1A-like isoform X1 n=2 Tax=Montipora capricornis TaxID=246305 RepID=UPI0035F10B53
MDFYTGNCHKKLYFWEQCDTMAKLWAAVFLITLFFSQLSAYIPTAVATALLSSMVEFLRCPFQECCTDKWISPNITGLQSSLERRVFGQHLVTDTVLKAVKGHLNNKSPNKALALSFNGWTGSGKNFVSTIIAEHLFRYGMESQYVHQIIATYDFPHQKLLDLYKGKLRDLVARSVAECPRSLFIFDEMDKMPIGLIDVLKPFLDHYTEVGKVDYRRSIFIFLSNTGAHQINEEMLTHWKEGKKREDIGIKHMDKIINLGEFNTKGGFWHSSLIEKNLIDYFIPFLPLERSHIKMCAKADLEQKKLPVTEKNLNSVADELLYFPEEFKVFSKSGCKKVSSKVDYIML